MSKDNAEDKTNHEKDEELLVQILEVLGDIEPIEHLVSRLCIRYLLTTFCETLSAINEFTDIEESWKLAIIPRIPFFIWSFFGFKNIRLSEHEDANYHFHHNGVFQKVHGEEGKGPTQNTISPLIYLINRTLLTRNVMEKNTKPMKYKNGIPLE